LILKHLSAASDVAVICLYRGDSPFKYARDGHDNGIKQESADIADAIMKGEYKNLTLVSMRDTCRLSVALRNCNWIIQATGFESRIPRFTDGTNEIIPTWDPATGLALSLSLPQLQAFGACVPNETNDISLGAFIDQHITRWPMLKAMIKI
jgi:hypothetical protein